MRRIVPGILIAMVATGCESLGPIATEMAEQYVASLQMPPAAPPPPEYVGGAPPPADYTTQGPDYGGGAPPPSPDAPPPPPPPPPSGGTAPPPPTKPPTQILKPAIVTTIAKPIVKPVLSKPLLLSTQAKTFSVKLRSDEKTRFDCSEVNDEFEALMFGDVLMNPGAFVETVGGRIDRADFEQSQRGRLRLAKAHTDHGVGLLKTSSGARAKFLYAFRDRDGDAPTLDLMDATVYGDGADGSSKRHGTMRLGPGSAVDLDFVETAPDAKPSAETVDIGYRLDEDGNPILESLGAAAVEFPTESLCGNEDEES